MSKEKVFIHMPPNTIPQIDRLWAILSTDETGEGIVAGGNSGMIMTFITAEEKNVKRLVAMAQKLSDQTGKSMRLVKFSSRDIIEEITPQV